MFDAVVVGLAVAAGCCGLADAADDTDEAPVNVPNGDGGGANGRKES